MYSSAWLRPLVVLLAWSCTPGHGGVNAVCRGSSETSVEELLASSIRQSTVHTGATHHTICMSTMIVHLIDGSRCSVIEQTLLLRYSVRRTRADWGQSVSHVSLRTLCLVARRFLCVVYTRGYQSPSRYLGCGYPGYAVNHGKSGLT